MNRNPREFILGDDGDTLRSSENSQFGALKLRARTMKTRMKTKVQMEKAKAIAQIQIE